MDNIADNINKVMRQMAFSVKSRKYSAPNPLLLAVSKGQPTINIRKAYQSGLRDFGENYLNEALQKIAELNDLPDINWHFLGSLQSNKTRPVAESFYWVHSIDRLKIAQRLSQQRPSNLPPLNLCIQVNIDAEPSKSGIHPDQALELAISIAQLPHVRLRGLMAIPKANWQQGPGNPFNTLRKLLMQLQTHPDLQTLDSLSMGMSSDYPQAIEAGSTIIRVGTKLFGARNPRQST